MLLRIRMDAWLTRDFLRGAFRASAVAAGCARRPPWSSFSDAPSVSCASVLRSILLKMPSKMEFRLGPRARAFKSSRFLAVRGASSAPKASRSGRYYGPGAVAPRSSQPRPKLQFRRHRGAAPKGFSQAACGSQTAAGTVLPLI